MIGKSLLMFGVTAAAMMPLASYAADLDYRYDSGYRDVAPAPTIVERRVIDQPAVSRVIEHHYVVVERPVVERPVEERVIVERRVVAPPPPVYVEHRVDRRVYVDDRRAYADRPVPPLPVGRVIDARPYGGYVADDRVDDDED